MLDSRYCVVDLLCSCVCLSLVPCPTTFTIPAHAVHALNPNGQGGEELCIKALIAFGADVNATNEFNMTPLDMACQNQVYTNIVE